MSRLIWAVSQPKVPWDRLGWLIHTPECVKHKTIVSARYINCISRLQTTGCQVFWLDRRIKTMKKSSTNVMLISWLYTPYIYETEKFRFWINPKSSFYFVLSRQAVDSTRDPPRELPTAARNPEGWRVQLCYHRLRNNDEDWALQLRHHDRKRLLIIAHSVYLHFKGCVLAVIH